MVTRYLRKQAAYDKLARDERKFVGGKIQGMCIGMAGTGAGTRIGGHLKYGGAKVRARLAAIAASRAALIRPTGRNW